MISNLYEYRELLKSNIKKEIRGKDIYDLIGVTEISLKFEELIGDQKYDEEEDEDEDDQYDNMDIVGDPNVDF